MDSPSQLCPFYNYYFVKILGVPILLFVPILILNYLSQINEVEFIVAELLDHPVLYNIQFLIVQHVLPIQNYGPSK